MISADLKTPLENGLQTQKGDANQSSSSPIVSDVSGHKKIIEDFVNAVKTDGTPRCDGSEGRRSVQLVQAIYESSQLGQPVDMLS